MPYVKSKNYIQDNPRTSFRNRDNNANTTPNELQPMLTITKLIQCGNDVVKNREALLRKTDETNQYIIGKLIDNSKSVGVVVDITPTTNASFACFVTECTPPCNLGEFRFSPL